jgi:hypothetical protein
VIAAVGNDPAQGQGDEFQVGKQACVIRFGQRPEYSFLCRIVERWFQVFCDIWCF